MIQRDHSEALVIPVGGFALTSWPSFWLIGHGAVGKHPNKGGWGNDYQLFSSYGGKPEGGQFGPNTFSSPTTSLFKDSVDSIIQYISTSISLEFMNNISAIVVLQSLFVYRLYKVNLAYFLCLRDYTLGRDRSLKCYVCSSKMSDFVMCHSKTLQVWEFWRSVCLCRVLLYCSETSCNYYDKYTWLMYLSQNQIM